MSAKDVASADARRAHWVVDGVPYAGIRAVYNAALKRGFTGTYNNIGVRLQSGDLTWERLLRPIDASRSQRASKTNNRKRDEMADVIAALDARKKAMAEGGEE